MGHANSTYQPLPDATFAALGGGEVAYLRKISPQLLKKLVPDAPPITPGLSLWGLVAADGTPLIITDDRNAAIENAREHDLTMVQLH